MMVRGLHPLGADCKVDTNHFVGKGALNLNASSQYLLAVAMESFIEGEDTEGAGGRLLASEKENRVILTEWTRQYFLYGAGGTSKLIAEESEPISGILEPNATTQLVMAMSMVGPSGAHEMRRLLHQASTGAGAHPGVEVVVRFQIRGKIVSSGRKVETPPMDFPTSVYLGKALPVCEEGQELAPVGPCGHHGGQDGVEPICCEMDPISRKCKT